MKKILFFLVMLIGAATVMGQSSSLSPRAAMLLKAVQNGKYDVNELNKSYTLVQSQGGASVNAFITLAEGTNERALASYGVTINSKAGNQMTALIPLERYAELAASGLCAWIDLGNKVQLYLDRARAELGVDYIHQGTNLPQGYDGSGVVVGVIDIGFEYGHPSFFDATDTTLRIKRVWQQLDNNGVPPSGFAYGTEYATQEQILAVGTDSPQNGHGSHTAGIAAGCGAPDAQGHRYTGMAPAADIVLVACNMEETGICDAVRYIHQYARSVGKPCVINASLGTLLGPHDGLGSMDVMMENYLHASHLDSIVMVVSAGNSGSKMNHLNKHFSANDTVVQTYMRDLISDDYNIKVDCWGDVGDEFSLSVSLYDILNIDDNPVLFSQLPEVSSTIDSVYSFQIMSPYDSVYNCDIAVTHSSPNNGRPEMLISIYKDGVHRGFDLFMLTVKSTSANVHLWSDEEEFFRYSNTWTSNGDYNYMIGGVGGNTEAVITAGSYATRTKRLNGEIITSNTEGNLSSFSSHGPTYDGRVKPDICAPGEVLVSSINKDYVPYYSSYIFDTIWFNGEIHYYALMQGTSMSSPATAGTVALWLQHNPSLNVDSVRALLHSSGRQDRFTGALAATGSNLWGWGKLNAFAGLPATALPMYQLDVTSEDNLHGYVTGQGRHPQGQHLIEAFPLEGYTFSHWSDGAVDNPRALDLVSDTSIVARFELAACDTIMEFPWEPMFNESSFNCWDNYGSSSWVYVSSSLLSMGSNGVDNWLITPHVLVEPQTSLFYDVMSITTDTIDIVAITADGDTNVLVSETYNPNDNECRHVSLTPYAGQTVRLGIHHHGLKGMRMTTLQAIKIDYLVGIEDAEAPSYSLTTSGLNITVSGASEGPLNVYDVTGRRVVTSTEANGTFTLPTTGVYIVRVGNLPARKVVVLK